MTTHLESDRVRDEVARAPSDPLIIVSNRGPIEHYFDDAGRLQRRPAAGGLATALAGMRCGGPMTWLAAPATDGDRFLAVMGRAAAIEGDRLLKYVDAPAEAYRLHYEAFCNPLLWFVQHGMADDLEEPPGSPATWGAWERGYRAVNRLYAERAVAEMGPRPGRVMLHDYHFYLAPREVRRLRPDTTIQQFIHIPWPEPDQWACLPDHMVREICRGLLGNDSLAFQTEESVDNFLATCGAYLGGEVQVLPARGEVRQGRHTTNVWANPISVDPLDLEAQVARPEARAYDEALAPAPGERLIVRVDRLDPSKNIVAGFEAFDRLLETRPQWRGAVRFLAFLVPSRTAIPEYADYRDRVFEAAARINARFGDGGYRPVDLRYEHNRVQALTALKHYDVLLVNPLADGMNLVSKEGPVLNRRDGVLVLSEKAGAHIELREGAISVDPLDVRATASALEAALSMPPRERRDRARRLRETIQRHQISDWLKLQLKDLALAEHTRSAITA